MRQPAKVVLLLATSNNSGRSWREKLVLLTPDTNLPHMCWTTWQAKSPTTRWPSTGTSRSAKTLSDTGKRA